MLPKRLAVGEDVGAPNPRNSPAPGNFSANSPPKRLIATGLLVVLDDPKKDGVVVLSFPSSSLRPNPRVVDGAPNKLPVLVEVGAPKKGPEDVGLEPKPPPNTLRLEFTPGGSPVDFSEIEEAKKFGIVEGLLSELVASLKPNVGAGGPPEDSEAEIEENEKLVDCFEPSIDTEGIKPLGFEPTEGVLEVSKGFGPEGSVGVDNFGAGEVGGTGGLDKLGALKRIDGPGSGPRGRVFLGELLKEPASCLSHTDWIARRLAEYWSKAWERSTKGSSLTAFVRKVMSE